MARRIRTSGAAIPMDPGERTSLVTIQQMTLTRGETKAPVETWTTLAANIWMKRMAIDPIRADYGEKDIGHQIAAQPQSTWEMGYRADMDPTLVNVAKSRRLLYRGRAYNIVAGDVIGAQEGIELIAISDGG